MPNIKTLMSAGAQASSWIITDPSMGTRFTSAQWAQLPEGKLKSVLTATYDSRESLYNALAEAGMRVTTIGSPFIGATGQMDARFDLDETSRPEFGVYITGSNPDGSIIVTLSTVYSVEA